MQKNFYKIIIACLATLVAATWAGDVTAPAGSARNLTADDFMPHHSNAKEFNETWSYQFVFDNGTRAFVNYSTLYIPGSGKKIGCDMSFWNFKGKSYAVGRQYPPERLKAIKEKTTIDIKGEYAMENKPGKGHRAPNRAKSWVTASGKSAAKNSLSTSIFPTVASRAESATTTTRFP